MIDFVRELWTIATDGGVLMIALFLLAIGLYWLAFDTLIRLPTPGASGATDPYALTSVTDVQLYRQGVIEYFKGRRVLLRNLVTVAPLLGLLGTVMGMLATFKGRATSNGDAIDLIAAGISEAMITTETGLVIAIPASLMVMVIGSRIDVLETAVGRSESRIARQLMAEKS